MARKAVQGYPEKSYYDNTRFSGVIATNDVLNEGYFKQLINFDISDTGMSVAPRKGYLTTTLKDANGYVTLSDTTVIYKDNELQQYVIFDLKNNKGYIVDISAYNVIDKTIPITTTINAENQDWNDVLDFLIRESSLVSDYYLFNLMGTDVPSARSLTLAYILSNLVVYSKLEMITDINMIRKAILKVDLVLLDSLEQEQHYPFILEMYYRAEANDVYASNTLIFSVTDITYHPTYIPTERNIASNKTVIPNPLQHLYTTVDRPASFASSVGSFLYFSQLFNNNLRYPINFVYKNIDYNIRPYFDLNPASIEINDDTALWAYRFDIVSTKKYTVEEQLCKDIIYASPWMSYRGLDISPISIFSNRSNTSDLTNPDRTKRHYKNGTIIINVVPNIINGEDTLSTRGADGANTGYTFTNEQTANERSHVLYDDWRAKINTIDSYETFKTAITGMAANALFYIYDLKNIETTSATSSFETAIESIYNTIDIADVNAFAETYKSYFKNASQLLDLYSTFKNKNIVFKLLPHVSKDYVTYSHYASEPDTYYYRYLFVGMPRWDYMEDVHDLLSTTYNIYNYNDVNTFFYADEYGYKIGTTTSQLKISIPKLNTEGFFSNGYNIIFYLRPYSPAELEGKTSLDLLVLQDTWTATAPYKSISNMQYGYDELTVTYIPEVLKTESLNIQYSKNFIVFNDNRLVFWKKNFVYISEPDNYYYFREVNKKEFGERIVKVLQFKTIILVFTVQHLYAIYESEIETSATDETGKLITTKTTMWLQQIVLYNILTSAKYADAIQIFNQMVLFYSEDGQMFMIKPNTMIDSETRFSLQYFNKAVNDILLNYDIYINDRLEAYNIETKITKDQVQIKALLSVNFIKIFYYVPNVITYIVIYDVINNRYTIYDTITFTNIIDKMFIDSGELYLTTRDEKLYFTFPYIELNQMDNVVDMSFADDFTKHAIVALIDVGTLNLNNHLNKRFRDLYVTFKNMNTSKFLFRVETLLDGIIARPFYEMRVEVQEVDGTSYFINVPKINENDLIDLINVATNTLTHALKENLITDERLLMDFSTYTSSKIITHKTSILGVGKVFGFKLQFVAKGSYKIQSFGIIYKERRI